MSELRPPQLVINSRMLYYTWIPADPEAAKALLDPRLTAADNTQIFMNQYVVDSAEQTSGFGAYSLTYIGLDVTGYDVPDGSGVPGRWWTHYFNSNAQMRDYAAERGVPASAGKTTIEMTGGKAVVTTYSEDTPVIRSVATVGDSVAVVGSGQLHYLTDVKGTLTLGAYPFIAGMVDGWAVESLEFLDPSHSVYALRPADPLQVTWGFYSPSASFAYPGGEGPVG